ncbi:MAG: hypothetical protein KI791_01880, partial [Cyclobacteriaceae bacterium]|nr:hypothetical protein [Cyclobacteriaceae bacterium SS2]
NSLVDIVKDVQDGKGTVGRLFSDSLLTQQINETVRNLNMSSTRAIDILDALDQNIGRVNAGQGTVGMLLNDSTLALRIYQIFEDLEASTRNVQTISQDIGRVLTQVQEGPGLSGSIMNDSTMVHNLEESLENIRQGTASFSENMEAMRHNFLFRAYFKKLEKEARKAGR